MRFLPSDKPTNYVWVFWLLPIFYWFLIQGKLSVDDVDDVLHRAAELTESEKILRYEKHYYYVRSHIIVFLYGRMALLKI